MHQIRFALMLLLALPACGIREHNLQPRASGGLPTPEPEPGQGGDSGSAGSGGAGGTRAGGSGGNRGNGGRSGSGGAPATPDAAPAVPAEPGVDLGGVRVPRARAIAIVHFGHSNMLGHGYDPPELRPYFFEPQPRLWSYRGNGRFVTAKEPTANPRNSNEGGPGMALLRAAVAIAPEDYHFISVGFGVGSATTQDWSKGGLYYDDFVARVRELRGNVTYGAAVIMLGITDRHLPAALQSGYTDRMVKIVSDLRADLGDPELPVLHTDYEVESSETLAVDGPVGMTFRPQILALPGKVSRLAIVPTDMTGMEDDHHFNLAGHKLFADRAIKLLVDKGWTRWPKP